MSSTSTYTTRDTTGDLVSLRTPAGTYYYLTDVRGSVVALTDAAGAVVNRYAYDPYGARIAAGTTEAVPNPYQYAGGERDANGLYHFGQRYYDPTVGRFTQTDPLVGGSANAYEYCNGDPINCTDVSGLKGTKALPDLNARCLGGNESELRRRVREISDRSGHGRLGLLLWTLAGWS